MTIWEIHVTNSKIKIPTVFKYSGQIFTLYVYVMIALLVIGLRLSYHFDQQQ